MLFLVAGIVEKTPYMSSTVRNTVLNIVEAPDEDQARNIFEKFYHQKSDPYGVHYYAYIQSISPVLTADMIKPEVKDEP